MRRAVSFGGQFPSCDDLGEWTGAVDVLEDAAAPLFDEPQRGDLPAHSVLDGPAPDAHGEDDSEQQSNEEDEVANGKQGGPGDDHNIVKGAHEDIERHIADVWIGVLEHTDAGDANPGTQGYLLYGWRNPAGHVRMAINGREHLAIGDQDIFVLRGLPDLRHHLSFGGDQVEEVPSRCVVG